MKVLVIGGGLIGVTTAYFLKRRGHEVTVIERHEGAGKETSFANGALLTPSMPEPWNAPGSWRVLLASLASSGSPLQLRLKAVPALMGWGVTFLRNSKAAAFERNTLSNVRLALHSLERLKSLRQETGIEFGHAARGSLKIFRDAAALDRATSAAERLAREGLGFRRLSPGETVELEPALAPIGHQLTGALHYGADETGDAHRFCVALAEHAQRQGVEFHFRSEVSALETRAGQVSAAVCHGKRLVADRYIVAAGSYSTPLLRRIGVRVPVRPAKGYSVTFERTPSLRLPIIDDHLHAAVVPLEGAIRVAGTAEFAGYDRTLSEARILNLLNLLKAVLPQESFERAAAKPWCGLRPMSADGVPIIGATPLSNLWLSTGHGHLGWTMAAGSAQLLADLMGGDTPAINPAPYDLKRFTC